MILILTRSVCVVSVDSCAGTDAGTDAVAVVIVKVANR